jgi:hypothetical protein
MLNLNEGINHGIIKNYSFLFHFLLSVQNNSEGVLAHFYSQPGAEDDVE